MLKSATSHRWSEQPWQLLADSRWSWADAGAAEEPEVWAEETPWHNLCTQTHHSVVNVTPVKSAAQKEARLALTVCHMKVHFISGVWANINVGYNING